MGCSGVLSSPRAHAKNLLYRRLFSPTIVGGSLVFVADRKGVLRHAEILPEMTLEHDEEAAIAVLRGLVVETSGPVAAVAGSGSEAVAGG